jgi:hypothetical protein
MSDTPETPKPQVTESGEYENLMELNEQNEAEAEANPDAFQSLFEVEETVVNPDHYHLVCTLAYLSSVQSNGQD